MITQSTQGTTTATAWSVGDELPLYRVSVNRERLVEYAAASGDHNRIHWDDEFARDVGLDGVIAHGMFTMGAAVEAVERCTQSGARVTSYTTKFSAPVPVPARGDTTLEVTGKCTAVSEDGSATWTLAVTCEGTKVLGLTRVVVAPAPTSM